MPGLVPGIHDFATGCSVPAMVMRGRTNRAFERHVRLPQLEIARPCRFGGVKHSRPWNPSAGVGSRNACWSRRARQRVSRAPESGMPPDHWTTKRFERLAYSCFTSLHSSSNLKCMQNKSHAVMSQRIESLDSPDDFPTPPWATRALLEHVLSEVGGFRGQTCLEPACGAGHMVKVLWDYFEKVEYLDAYDYGFGPVGDFLKTNFAPKSVDWVITNPPFRLAEEFLEKALGIARIGVAILARTVFLESVGRYRNIFMQTPPSRFAQFTERVPMLRGRLDAKATTATGYGWFVWETSVRLKHPKLLWIPPCRKQLEFAGDYSPAKVRRRDRSAQIASVS